jgi:hypothetical protein
MKILNMNSDTTLADTVAKKMGVQAGRMVKSNSSTAKRLFFAKGHGD